MPEKLVRSSAETRAKNARLPLAVVLADWANVDLDDLKAQAAEAPAATPAAETQEPAPAEDPAVETPAEAAQPAAAAAATGAAISVEALLDQVAADRGMPASLTKRSAEARAKETGGTLESVLAEWAGIDPATVGATETTPAPETPAPAESPAAPVAAAAAATIGMDELLEKVAEAKGMPAALAKRSAEARAKKTGEPLENELAEWAGVDPATVASDAPAPAAAPAAAAPAAPAPSDEAPAKPEGDIEVIEATATEEGGDGVAGKVPSPAGRYPAWLAAAFLIIPLLAVTYILLSPNGPDCGSGGQLLVNPVTGDAVNCDGTDYGTFTINYLANGAAIYTQCAACHNADGSGGAGPAFVGGSILTTFPEGSCADQIEWIALGTAGFPEPTYGATDKPVGGFGVMPGFGATLEPEQIAEVALYERVQFGGEAVDVAEVDCGLVDEEGEPIEQQVIDGAEG
jgi:hypothetical protein